MPSVAIIILTKNNFDVFKSCVDSIINYNTYDDIELFVGDTGSDQQQFDQLKCYLMDVPIKKQLIKFDYYNFAKNHNWIVSNMINHEYILFCNDDIEFKCDVIANMMNHVDPVVATIGCKLLFPDGTIQHAGHLHVNPPASHNHAMNYNITHRLLGQPNQQIETQHVHGNTFALCLVNIDMFTRLNMLDESYERCFEDADFCIRATAQKFKHVCVGDVECLHHESISRKKESVLISTNDMFNIRYKLYDLYNSETYVTS